jgi:hypothetical protein
MGFGMRNILAAAALVTAGLAGSAGAAVVTYDFVATDFTVYTIGNIDLTKANALMAAIGGGAVTGRITYDTAAGVDVGSYFGPEDFRTTHLRFPGSLSVTINGTTYEATPPTFVFSVDKDMDENGEAFNSFDIGDNPFVGPGESEQELFEAFNINVSASGARTWDGVTPTVAQLNAATDRFASFAFSNNSGVKATKVTFSAPVVAPVPLPAGGVLLVSVIAGLAMMRRPRAGVGRGYAKGAAG